MQQADCEFCNIIRGEKPARIVYQSADTTAFFPLKPAALGHTLVVPNDHIPDIWALAAGSAESADPLTRAVLRMAEAIRTALKPDGLNVINSAGEAASQTVFHLHIHLVPRWREDHIGNIWPPSEPWSEEVKDDVLVALQEACSQ
ncbi:MAG: HIT domain-containing protein [Actinomycetota bacterium]|nr:HIT domain-containing protein [Actinomycetota bacterium]